MSGRGTDSEVCMKSDSEICMKAFYLCSVDPPCTGLQPSFFF